MESPGIGNFLVPTFSFQATRPSSPQPSILSFAFVLARAGDVDSERMQRFHFYSNPAAKKKVGLLSGPRLLSPISLAPISRLPRTRRVERDGGIGKGEREEMSFSFLESKLFTLQSGGAARSAGTHHFEFRMGAFEERGKRSRQTVSFLRILGQGLFVQNETTFAKKKYITLAARNKTAPSFEGTLLFLPSNT